LKLREAGLDDDTIAALDCRGEEFDPRWQAALAYASKLTLEPQLIGGDDIAKLKQHFTDPEIIELTFVISRFNATNRWTDGMGIPQDRRFSDRSSVLDTATSAEFQQTKSVVEPSTRRARPQLPPIGDVLAAIAACREITPRVELPSDEQAASALGETLGDRTPATWERAMSQLSETGKTQVATWNTIVSDDHLAPRLKAELAFIAAVHNRAWYAAGHALDRLSQRGVSKEEITALLVEEDAAAGPAHRLAAKLTADPHLITDADIAAVREHFNDRETAQIVQTIAMANMFDRFTSALG
jgi:alkylhydroperoxidase family enzyme